MFKNIILANDLEFEYSVNSPTMMIEGMTVAGKWAVIVLLALEFQEQQ